MNITVYVNIKVSFLEVFHVGFIVIILHKLNILFISVWFDFCVMTCNDESLCFNNHVVQLQNLNKEQTCREKLKFMHKFWGKLQNTDSHKDRMIQMSVLINMFEKSVSECKYSHLITSLSIPFTENKAEAERPRHFWKQIFKPFIQYLLLNALH